MGPSVSERASERAIERKSFRGSGKYNFGNDIRFTDIQHHHHSFRDAIMPHYRHRFVSIFLLPVSLPHPRIHFHSSVAVQPPKNGIHEAAIPHHHHF